MITKIINGLLIVILSTSVVEASKIYKLKGKAPAGSTFKPTDAKSMIPFYKTYHQLTPVQQNIYRLDFVGLTNKDIPPFPKGGIQSIYRPLIKGHEKIARGGFLSLKALVNEKGEVDEVSVYLSPAEKMTELAIAVLFNTKFTPASCDGKACKMEYPFEFEMRERDKVITSLDKENFGNNSRR